MKTMEFTQLLETVDFWDAVELYLENGCPSERETLNEWKQLNAEQKSLVETLFHERSDLDIQDCIFRIYIDGIFPDLD